MFETVVFESYVFVPIISDGVFISIAQKKHHVSLLKSSHACVLLGWQNSWRRMRTGTRRTAPTEVHVRHQQRTGSRSLDRRKTGSRSRLFRGQVSAGCHQCQRTATRNAAENPRTISRHVARQRGLVARQRGQTTPVLGSSSEWDLPWPPSTDVSGGFVLLSERRPAASTAGGSRRRLPGRTALLRDQRGRYRRVQT